LQYNGQKSFDQTDPQCRQWVRDVRMEAVPFATAMQQILDPVGLRYEVENGEVVLYRQAALPPADPARSAASPKSDKPISYSTDKKSVQYVVIDLAAKVGLRYNWQKSFAQTDPQCRQWVRDVQMDKVPFAIALRQILDPVGLRYEVEQGEVVLYRAANAPPPTDAERPAVPPSAAKVISYTTDKKSVQYIVIDLAARVGLGYNWQKSFAQTDPECRRFVNNVSIKNQPFEKAMAKILDPVGLRYRVEGSQVVLYRR
jgi:hypothetical protein